MNLKLVKLQILACSLSSLVLVGEWGYGVYAKSRLQDKLQQSFDDGYPEAQLPVVTTHGPNAEAYNELVERPLFVEGRKPVIETSLLEEQHNVENGQIDEWSLIGVYNKGDRPRALFAHKNETKKYLKIGQEQTISGWRLKEIHPDRVVLQQAEQQKSVLLRKPRAESKPPVPGKPAVPPRMHAPANINPENSNDDSEKN